MKKIMVCFDGSETAEDAVRFAAARAEAISGEVLVVTTIRGGPEVPRETFVARERELDWAKSLLEEMAIQCSTRLIIGSTTPGEELVRFALENQVDEIIVGVRKRSRVGKLVFGSTAQYVILNAPCPVVTMK